MRRICAIYDKDERYAYRFMNYVNDKHLLPYEVVIFTKKEVLLEYLKESRVELLLRASGTEELETGLPIGRILMLSEDPMVREGVYKYQSIDRLVKQVLQQMGGEESELIIRNGNCKVYGVYSPVARSYKTTLSLGLALNAARNGRTLYVNLEEFCGISQLINDIGGNLSELLYYYRNSKEKLKAKITAAVRNCAGFDYIPVCSTPEDYEEVRVEEWAGFLEFLVGEGGYDTVVLDIGDAVHEAWKLIGLCEVSFMPVSRDRIGQQKERRFQEFLQQIGRENILSRIKAVEVPYDEEIGGIEEMERLQWSKLGEYSRGLIYG